MNQKIVLALLIALFSSSAFAGQCAIRFDSTFDSNFDIENMNFLEYKTEIFDALQKSTRGYQVVPSTVIKQEKKCITSFSGCNPPMEDKYETVQTVSDNPDYDYKLTINQQLNVKSKQYTVQIVDKNYAVQASEKPTNIVLKTTFNLVNRAGKPVSDGHRIFNGHPTHTSTVTTGDLSEGLTDVVQHAHEAIQDYLLAFPACSELTK